MGTHHVDFSLYLVTDRSQTRGHPLSLVVEQCLEAGLRALQVREKDLPALELLELALPLYGLTQKFGAKLFINDRVDVALAIGAEGIQRTHHSLPTAAIRRVAGAEKLIGVSVHSLEEARTAQADGADFVVFGPVYDTPSKRPYGPPQGLEPLTRCARAISIPVFAIGGITPERVSTVKAAGARGVAVISAIIAAERPGDVTKAFLDALGSA
ncbi:MAG: thiamine phosphate synthase [candidate division NC10 bacterium]